MGAVLTCGGSLPAHREGSPGLDGVGGHRAVVVRALLPGDLGRGVCDLVHPHMLGGPRRAWNGMGNQAEFGEALGITSSRMDSRFSFLREEENNSDRNKNTCNYSFTFTKLNSDNSTRNTLKGRTNDWVLGFFYQESLFSTSLSFQCLFL